MNTNDLDMSYWETLDKDSLLLILSTITKENNRLRTENEALNNEKNVSMNKKYTELNAENIRMKTENDAYKTEKNNTIDREIADQLEILTELEDIQYMFNFISTDWVPHVNNKEISDWLQENHIKGVTDLHLDIINWNDFGERWTTDEHQWTNMGEFLRVFDYIQELFNRKMDEKIKKDISIYLKNDQESYHEFDYNLILDFVFNPDKMMEWATKEPDKEDEVSHNAWGKTNKILVGRYKGLIHNGIRAEMQDIIDQWGAGDFGDDDVMDLIHFTYDDTRNIFGMYNQMKQYWIEQIINLGDPNLTSESFEKRTRPVTELIVMYFWNPKIVEKQVQEGTFFEVEVEDEDEDEE